MTSQLQALCFAALDPQRLAEFWAEILGWEAGEDQYADCTLLPRDDTGFRLRFLPTDEPKGRQNQMHLDLTSRSAEDQRQTVDRALRLGARHTDVGQRPDEPHVVLADPEGSEFCVIEPGNAFLADCGFLGAVACDGSQEVGHFWSQALGWPLVWDQDQETAIRSPYGGPKITWGGRPYAPGSGRNRLHFDVAVDGDLRAETDRLIALGAGRVDSAASGAAWVMLTDPDGNEFCVVDVIASSSEHPPI